MSRHRDVTWVLQKLRTLLLGREWTPESQLRFKANMSSRSPPMPLIPNGVAHKLSDNSYVKRDVRRLVMPPKDYVNAIHEGKQIEAKVGQTLMSAALSAGIEIESSCEGNCACSTCHVYVNQSYYDRIPAASEEEEDMLDLALFVQPNSRLSCQIIMTPELDGLEFKLPSATRNFYALKDKSGTTTTEASEDGR